MQLAAAPLTDVSLWARSSGLEIVLYVTGAVLLTRVAQWVGSRVTDRIDLKADQGDPVARSEDSKHRHALTQVLTWCTLALIYCMTAVLVLARLGVPVTGLVAPAAVAGVALGFGTQRLVQDVLAGFFAVVERQYGFGDLIRISALGTQAPISGTVEELTLRITRLRTTNGEVVITPNGQITQVTNLSRDWARAVIDVPVPASVDVHHATEVLTRVGQEAYADETLRPFLLDEPTVMGVESLQVDSFQIRVVARTMPGKQYDVGRELRARITAAFREQGVNVPVGLDTATPTGSDT